MNKIKCNICGKYFRSLSNTHLKTHNLTQYEYRMQFPNSPFFTTDMIEQRSLKHKGKTYEEIMGAEKATYLKQQRSSSAKKQMLDKNQILVRRLKCGLPEYYTETRRANMARASNDPNVSSRRAQARINKMEAGEYKKSIFGRQSNQAILFIQDYLQQQNISDDMCYYHKGGITNNEYYQVVFDPISNRKKCIAFDLVITYDGKHKIKTIIEINGPWHYRLEDVLKDPHAKACPLKTNKYTKLEAYNADVLKINKALELCDNVFIFWLDTQIMERIETPLELIN